MRLKCPVCKSVEIKSHYSLVEPVRYGGSNSVDHYSCKHCGIIFYATEGNRIPPEKEKDIDMKIPEIVADRIRKIKNANELTNDSDLVYKLDCEGIPFNSNKGKIGMEVTQPLPKDRYSITKDVLNEYNNYMSTTSDDMPDTIRMWIERKIKGN